MIKNEINTKLREYAKTLSPTEEEKTLIGSIYKELKTMFGENNCIQIGSFPRFTSITPVHDLDILYCMGEWNNGSGVYSPDDALKGVCDLIRQNYTCPTDYSFTVELQNHSVVIEFKGKKNMSVDIVPCYSFGQNEYELPRYKVPHIIKEKDRPRRHAETWDPLDRDQWISSDPRGYIKQATDVGINPDFRKAVKIIKFWKHTLRDIDDSLKLKSFHLEQVITQKFQTDPNLDLAGAVFEFFIELIDIVEQPNCIEDRAQVGKYIDDYLEDLSVQQKHDIKLARNNVLFHLEEIDYNTSISTIFTADTSEHNPDEQYMFNFEIPVFTTSNPSSKFSIDYDEEVQGRRVRRLIAKGKLTPGKRLYFTISEGKSQDYIYYWKVKNSNALAKEKRRGEITKNQTKNNPENTEYDGDHYVECYAVDQNGICVGRTKVDVPIGRNND